MTFSMLLLSRIQFGLTIGFHIIFPTLNIGLAVFICIMEARWLKTKNSTYLKICKFWTKIFALTFGMGVVSGIVLSYELGTNFGRFTEAVGQVLGPLFAYEVLSAFFLEAGFLGIMLFGWKYVKPQIHFIATLLVTIGTIISAFWIMSANSWMQTPSGYYLTGKVFNVTNWTEVIFNPLFLPRFFHMLMASFVTATFVIIAVSSWYILKHRYLDIAKVCLSFAMVTAVIISPLQFIIGDTVGLYIHQYQPIKIAGLEANWNTTAGAPLVLFAIPDLEKRENRYAITIPYGASLLNTHRLTGVLEGLTAFPEENWPMIRTIFFSFRIMVGIGILFILISLYGVWLLRKKHLYENRFFLRVYTLIAPLGFIATLAGWITAESGRQPWIVYGLMRTKNATSEVPAEHVFISLVLFIIVYGIIFSFYLYYLFKFIRTGPKHLDEPPLTLAYIPHPKDEGLKK